MLRTKLDCALKRCMLSDPDKNAVRAQIHAFCNTFPAERLWLYFKIMRNLSRCDVDDIVAHPPELELGGAEDDFAEGELTRV